MACGLVSLHFDAKYAGIFEKQTHDAPIMVDIHIDSFHAYYAVSLEINRWVCCLFFQKPVPAIMESSLQK